MARTVQAPDGRTWTIRRRWLHRPDWRAPELEGSDLLGAATDVPLVFDSIAAAITTLALAILFVALFVYALPVILFVAGLAFALAGVGARLLAIRPWTIEARADGQRLEWRARGWRRSGRVLTEVAAALTVGETDVEPQDALYRGRGV